jgi:predicted neuraminidase
MPMDFNEDGKLDLLVACPDKPSNGVWFFENIGDPTEKLPIFRAGVRLGPAAQNMQVSYVNGQPRILVPGSEHVDFRQSKFERPAKKIYPRTSLLEPGRKIRANMWRYVDYEGDGDHDLIVGVDDWSDLVWDNAHDHQGRWRNGPLHGWVYLIENQGTDVDPKFSDSPVQLTTEKGAAIEVYGWPSPNFADFDGDRDLDLLCGEFLDGFTYFENVGSRQTPSYAAGRRLLDSHGESLRMYLQMVTPTAFDWTKDGHFDLIVGDEDGRVALIEHSGRIEDGLPVFHPPQYFQQQADTLKFGALATPFIADWDADGAPDILCGNTAGNIGWFRNLGKGANGLPIWSSPKLLETDSGEVFRIMAGESGSIQGPCEAKWGYTCMSVVDWNGDKQLDIVFNSILGRISLLLGTDDKSRVRPARFDMGVREYPPKWAWWQSPSTDTLTQWRTTPLAVDFDRDGNLDLVALDQEGFLALRRRDHIEGEPTRIFVDEDLKPLRLNGNSCGASGRVKLATVDWDNDGRLDLLVNSKNATWYRNCEDRNGRVVLKKIGDLGDRDVSGHTCSPTVGDLDGSGKPGILIGAEDGRLYYIRHDDCRKFSPEQLVARPPHPIEEPRFPGLISEEFIYDTASFPQCHASTIVETNRGLVAAWFGGTKEKDPDVGIWSSYREEQGWTKPVEWANGIQHAAKRHPCWNPVLFQPPGDGPTLLFFKVGPSPKEWWGEMMVSYDRGRSFRDRRRLPEGIDGPVRCKPVLLGDDVLLAGSSTEYDGWVVHFEKGSLQGGIPDGNWRRIGPINTQEEFHAIQPTFLRHPQERLQVLCRTQQNVVATSFSDDRGDTWSGLVGIDLPNNNSGIDAVTLRDGRHLLVYNHLPSGSTGWGGRGLLNLAISEDGLSWHKAGVLEQEKNAEFSYPAIIQSQDGLVHLTWTWKRKRIKHVVIDPNKIVAGSRLTKEQW